MTFTRTAIPDVIDGFIVLSDEATIAYNDSSLQIDWLVHQNQHKVFTKDTQHPSFNQAELF
ncbi:MAG: hypothetical protein J0647_02410 [Campylobacteraceae bacterium]|nr:hypothetical protein [Campylobacteraceae bacterium]